MLHLKKLISISLDTKKPWITSGFQKPVYIKNKLLKMFINKKDPQPKAIIGIILNRLEKESKL